MYPIQDLLRSLYRKHQHILGNCFVRRERMYASGYKDALDDVLNGLLEIQANKVQENWEKVLKK